MSPAISLMVTFGHEAVVGRDEDEALVHERLRLLLHVGLVARLPAAAVNPEDDRVVLALGRGVDIERLPLVLRLGVGDVTAAPPSRAESYSVYVYDQFPSIPLDPGGDYGGSPPSYGVFPIWTSAWANVDSVRYAGPALQAGHTYYWIVTAVDATETAYSYSELRSFTAE